MSMTSFIGRQYSVTWRWESLRKKLSLHSQNYSRTTEFSVTSCALELENIVISFYYHHYYSTKILGKLMKKMKWKMIFWQAWIMKYFNIFPVNNEAASFSSKNVCTASQQAEFSMKLLTVCNLIVSPCLKFGFWKFLSCHKCIPSQDETLSNESS